MKHFILGISVLILTSSSNPLQLNNKPSLHLIMIKDHLFYKIENNSDQTLIFNVFSGDNKKNFRLTIFDSNGNAINDSCPNTKFYDSDYLYDRKEYKKLKPGRNFLNRLRWSNCLQMENLSLKNMKGYKLVLTYYFDSSKYSNQRKFKLLEKAWSGTIVSDTLIIE